MRILAVVRFPHSDLGDEDAYHQWVVPCDAPRVKADSLGRLNPRMWSADWLYVVCNNTECAGEAIVHEDALVSLVDEALATKDHKVWSA